MHGSATTKATTAPITRLRSCGDCVSIRLCDGWLNLTHDTGLGFVIQLLQINIHDAGLSHAALARLSQTDRWSCWPSRDGVSQLHRIAVCLAAMCPHNGSNSHLVQGMPNGVRFEIW